MYMYIYKRVCVHIHIYILSYKYRRLNFQDDGVLGKHEFWFESSK